MFITSLGSQVELYWKALVAIGSVHGHGGSLYTLYGVVHAALPAGT